MMMTIGYQATRLFERLLAARAALDSKASAGEKIGIELVELFEILDDEHHRERTMTARRCFHQSPPAILTTSPLLR